MNPTHEDDRPNASREEIMAALFANMVIQQSNMAFMFLGKVPHPETGEIYRDLQAAKMFIDQLEMIEEKTKGNLSPRESQLIKQSLTTLRMAFVEEVQQGDEPPAAREQVRQPEPAEAAAEPPPAALSQPEKRPGEPSPIASPASSEDSDSRKRFTKKY